MSKGDKPGKSSGRKKQEVQRAMNRLEDAVKDLGEAAKGNFAERAAEVLEQTAARLKSEQATGAADTSSNESGGRATGSDWGFDFGTKPQPDGDGFSAAGGRMEHWQGARATRPFRDLDNGRLWGICAGTAPYLGLEIWVVRCIAVTCFVFMPQVIVPAYLIAYFVLDPYSELDEQFGPTSTRRSRKLRKRRLRQAKAEHRAQERAARRAARAPDEPAKPQSRRQRRAAAAATPPPPPTRTVLRNVKGTLNEAELRLRRMEGHVTSGRYELQKELRKIDA